MVPPVDAGQECARRLGALVSYHVMGRPARDTEDFVLNLADAGRKAFGENPATRDKSAEASPEPDAAEEAELPPSSEAVDAALLAALSGFPGGYSAQSLSKQLRIDWEIVRDRLNVLCAQGLLAKRRGRYHRAGADGGQE